MALVIKIEEQSTNAGPYEAPVAPEVLDARDGFYRASVNGVVMIVQLSSMSILQKGWTLTVSAPDIMEEPNSCLASVWVPVSMTIEELDAQLGRQNIKVDWTNQMDETQAVSALLAED